MYSDLTEPTEDFSDYSTDESEHEDQDGKTGKPAALIDLTGRYEVYGQPNPTFTQRLDSILSFLKEIQERYAKDQAQKQLRLSPTKRPPFQADSAIGWPSHEQAQDNKPIQDSIVGIKRRRSSSCSVMEVEASIKNPRDKRPDRSARRQRIVDALLQQVDWRKTVAFIEHRVPDAACDRI